MSTQPPSDRTDEFLDQSRLADELSNFKEIARHLIPSSGNTPQIEGIEISGFSMPLTEIVGGDHIIYLDFNKRYDLQRRVGEAEAKGRPAVAAKLGGLADRAGILLADVSGHRMTDALVAAMLHQAFLLGAYYELDRFGEITTRLFQHINTRFYRTTAVNKYITMIYGEISGAGKFRFVSAGHPPPAVFSREYRRFVRISTERLTTFPPLGLLPSGEEPQLTSHAGLPAQGEDYAVNEIDLLTVGDILLLYTDGLSEHLDGRYFKDRLEPLLATHRDEGADRLSELIQLDLRQGEPLEDDISLIVVRRSA